MVQNNLCVTLTVEFLKHYGIRRLVLSPGTRNIPFVTTVEVDPYFECYSAVDERSAAFFALGMAQRTGEIVAMACTSGTAVSNYLPGLTEAYYAHIPVLALTCDRSPYVLAQLETQKIDQVGALHSVVKKSLMMPLLKDHDDVWCYERLFNEAVHALRKDTPGPVHINIPMVGDTNAMWDEKSRSRVQSDIKYIDYVACDDNVTWAAKAEQLAGFKRVLVVLGQHAPGDDAWVRSISAFAEKFRCPILCDHLASCECPERVESEAVIKGLTVETFKSVLPDIVITAGLNFQERIKDLFKGSPREFEHWGIDAAGEIRDCFKAQTAVFHCAPEVFFARMTKMAVSHADGQYLAQWRKLNEAALLPELPYSNFSVVRMFASQVPRSSLVHLAIQNAVRLMQFFRVDASIAMYSNVNAFGIEGCLPTFMGQAAVSDQLAFLLIGDLSFFYGMNAMALRTRRPNVRVLILNNHGAAEFHIPPASHAIPSIDRHIGVAHQLNARGWVESLGYEYLSCANEQELQVSMPKFVRVDADRPIVLEAFTDMRTDGEFCLSVYRSLIQKLNAICV